MKKQTISYQGFKLEGNFREMALLECSDLSLVNEKWLALTGLALAFFLLEPIFQPVGSRHSRAIFSVYQISFPIHCNSNGKNALYNL